MSDQRGIISARYLRSETYQGNLFVGQMRCQTKNTSDQWTQIVGSAKCGINEMPDQRLLLLLSWLIRLTIGFLVNLVLRNSHITCYMITFHLIWHIKCLFQFYHLRFKHKFSFDFFLLNQCLSFDLWRPSNYD